MRLLYCAVLQSYWITGSCYSPQNSVEIPTRCSFVIEFIIPKFIEGSTCFEREHRSSSGALNCICSLWCIYPCGDRPLPRLSGKWNFHFPLSLDNGRSPHGYINQRLQIQFRAPDDERCARSKHVEPSINFGIINSVTKLHLVSISTESSTMHGSMNIKA